MDAAVRHKYTVIAGAFVTVWIVTGVVCAIMVRSGLGHWLELLNGATWPAAFAPVASAATEQNAPAPALGFWFYATLSLRTLLNLGVLLSALLALSWFASGGFERMVMKRIDALSKVRDAALVGVVLDVLEKAHIELPKAVEDEVYAAARRFDGTAVAKAIKRRSESRERGGAAL